MLTTFHKMSIDALPIGFRQQGEKKYIFFIYMYIL